MHRHIFKVGWLLTHNFQTTTMLYYTFFLPGVLLHEASRWLMAGILNVRPEGSIQWPEKQEIAELKLNFVKLAKNTPMLKLAIIATTPILIGLAVVWWIANSVFDVNQFLSILNQPRLAGIVPATTFIASRTDFWLWIYLTFAISNTMMHNARDLEGWRPVLMIAGATVVLLFIAGIGGQVVFGTIIPSLTNIASVITAIFTVIIGIDLLLTAILGIVEALIERSTGHSATFEKGKLVAMRREELVDYKRRLAARSTPPTRRALPIPESAGAPSIYKLPLPIPGPPGKETISPPETLIVSPQLKPPLPQGGLWDERSGPALITPDAPPTERPPLPSTPPTLAPRPLAAAPFSLPTLPESADVDTEVSADDSDDENFEDEASEYEEDEGDQDEAEERV